MPNRASRATELGPLKRFFFVPAQLARNSDKARVSIGIGRPLGNALGCGSIDIRETLAISRPHRPTRSAEGDRPRSMVDQEQRHA